MVELVEHPTTTELWMQSFLVKQVAAPNFPFVLHLAKSTRKIIIPFFPLNVTLSTRKQWKKEAAENNMQINAAFSFNKVLSAIGKKYRKSNADSVYVSEWIVPKFVTEVKHEM